MALHYRNRTGKGQFVDMSQSENLAPYFGEAVIDYSMNGNIQGTLGNRSPREAPQGAYRCAGPDNWIAITVMDSDEWQALCKVMDRADLAADEGLAMLAGRITVQTGAIVVGGFLTVAAVTYYGIAMRLVEMAKNLLRAATTTPCRSSSRSAIGSRGFVDCSRRTGRSWPP